MGLAAALLVFTGIWHLTETLMDRASKDAAKLIPFGVIYLVFGTVIAMGFGGLILAIVTALIVIGGMSLAIIKRKEMDVRRWVLLAFVLIDVIIVLAILTHWL